MNGETDDPEAFAYDRSPGYQQRTFDEHNANVIAVLRAKIGKARKALR